MPVQTAPFSKTESTYLELCKKAFRPGIGGHIFLCLFFGEVFGTVAFGLFGTVFYFLLLILGLAVRRKALERMKHNQNDIRLLIDSTVIIVVILLEFSNMGFAGMSMARLESFSSIFTFSVYGAASLGCYLVYLIVLSAILYFRTKAKFSPEENPFEKTSKGMKIVGAIAVGGGSAGMLLAKIIRNISILSVILCAGVLFLDIFFFSFLSYYILMYRHLKAKAPAEKAG